MMSLASHLVLIRLRAFVPSVRTIVFTEQRASLASAPMTTGCARGRSALCFSKHTGKLPSHARPGRTPKQAVHTVRHILIIGALRRYQELALVQRSPSRKLLVRARSRDRAGSTRFLAGDHHPQSLWKFVFDVARWQKNLLRGPISLGGIGPFGREYFAVTSHHVKVEAIGRNRVPTNLARHSPGRLRDRLFQQWSSFQTTPGSMLVLPTGRAVPTPL